MPLRDIVILIKLVHSLKEFSKYISKFKNSLRRVKASTRKDTTSIESITSFKKGMRYGCTLVRKGCTELRFRYAVYACRGLLR